mgnify:CR=1 FL=1
MHIGLKSSAISFSVSTPNGDFIKYERGKQFRSEEKECFAYHKRGDDLISFHTMSDLKYEADMLEAFFRPNAETRDSVINYNGDISTITHSDGTVVTVNNAESHSRLKSKVKIFFADGTTSIQNWTLADGEALPCHARSCFYAKSEKARVLKVTAWFEIGSLRVTYTPDNGMQPFGTHTTLCAARGKGFALNRFENDYRAANEHNHTPLNNIVDVTA